MATADQQARIKTIQDGGTAFKSLIKANVKVSSANSDIVAVALGDVDKAVQAAVRAINAERGGLR